MKVLITLDGSALADRALKEFSPWARTMSAEVHLLTVLDPRDTHDALEDSGRPARPAGYGTALATRSAVIPPSPAVVVDRGRELESVRANAEDDLREKAGLYLR